MSYNQVAGTCIRHFRYFLCLACPPSAKHVVHIHNVLFEFVHFVHTIILLIFCVPEPYAQHLFWQPVTTTPLAVEPSSLTSSSPLTLLTVLSEVLSMAYRDAATGNMTSVWEDTSSESWIKDVSGSTPTNGSASGSNAETSRMGVSISEWHVYIYVVLVCWTINVIISIYMIHVYILWKIWIENPKLSVFLT